MRFLIAALIVSVALPAMATRYGRDERIFSCISDAKTVPEVGANLEFKVHHVDLESVTITRVSDGRFLTASYNYAHYSFGPELNSSGDLLAPSQKGYVSHYNGNFSFVFYHLPGLYEGSGLLKCKLEKVISSYDPLTETELKVQAIGEEANVANGGYEFSRFAVPLLDLGQEKEKLKDEGAQWEQCTWEMAEGFPKILDLIENHTEDSMTAKSVKALEADPGVLAALAYVSDNDISCSNTIIRIYTKDGTQFELFYSLGD